MPIPWRAGQWNKAGLNRITKHIAPWMPGFGIVVHRGRHSGRPYQTPVNVFATEDGYVLALIFGPDTDWSGMSWPRAVASCGRAGGPSG